MKIKIIAALLLILAAVFAAYNFSFQTVEATIDHKAITGMKGDTSYGIALYNNFDGKLELIVSDSELRERFGQNGAIVDQSLVNELSLRYDEVHYFVSLLLETPDRLNGIPANEALAYYASRQDFNKAEIGVKVKCRVSRWAWISNTTILS